MHFMPRFRLSVHLVDEIDAEKVQDQAAHDVVGKGAEEQRFHVRFS
jgi:hypothetical protein